MFKSFFLSFSLFIISSSYASNIEASKSIDQNDSEHIRRLSKCMACHGQHFERSTFDKAAVLKGQSAANIEASLLAYKTGPLNKTGFGELMKGQVKEISDADLKSIAASIANTK